MIIYAVLYILFVHWVSDFVFQTHEMSIKKSKSNKWLSYHVGIYSAITTGAWSFFLFFIPMEDRLLTSMLLFAITFTTHWVTDYFTSRWTSKLYAEGDIHNFFVVVGLDQFIHYTTLLFTYKYLFL